METEGNGCVQPREYLSAKSDILRIEPQNGVTKIWRDLYEEGHLNIVNVFK